MNTRQLQYILMIASTGSFSEAAKRLYVSQPSLSQYVHKLETELGVNLFERTNPLRLTYAGEVYVEAAKGILAREQEAVKIIQDISCSKAGRVIIGVGPYNGAMLMPTVCRRFSELYPEIRIELSEQLEVLLPESVRQGACEFAISTQPIQDPAFTVINLATEDFVLAVPTSFELNRKYDGVYKEKILPTIDISECAGYPFIKLRNDSFSRRVFDDICSIHNFEPQIIAECSNIVSVHMMAAAGAGISLVPSSALAFSDGHQNCRYYRINGNRHRREVNLFFLKPTYLTQPTQKLINIIRECCKASSI